MAEVYIRVNGTGNAWPVPLGSEHPYYDTGNCRDLANASFSVIKEVDGRIEWEVLIDAGHGIVQYLLQTNNRIPDAVLLTHPHLDHTLSLDWIIQSAYRHHKKEKLFPVYASARSWDFVASSFPQLPPLSEFNELLPGRQVEVKEAPGLRVTALPVYHGERAHGPNMLVVEVEGAKLEDGGLEAGRSLSAEPEGAKRGSVKLEGGKVKAVFTGDVLCPMLRKQDYEYINGSGYLFVDANNRFPYTRSNHWSIVSHDPGSEEGRPGDKAEGFWSRESNYLKEWRSRFSPSLLLAPHLSMAGNEVLHPYFDTFLKEADARIPLSVFEFVRRSAFEKVMLVHYGGGEDKLYHERAVLSKPELADWTKAQASAAGLSSTFLTPVAGDVFPLF